MLNDGKDTSNIKIFVGVKLFYEGLNLSFLNVGETSGPLTKINRRHTSGPNSSNVSFNLEAFTTHQIKTTCRNPVKGCY